MSDDQPQHPQIYLITEPDADRAGAPDRLAACLDAAPVACVLLRMGGADADRIARAADQCRSVTDARDVALVVEDHLVLAERLGLDGVHLTDGPRSVAAARKALGEDAIVGAYCGTSRHDGMTAGERGADYITFGPAGATDLGDGQCVEPELFAWWSQMIELPVVAEGGLTTELVTSLAPAADFFALGPEIWAADSPEARLAEFLTAIKA